MVLREKRNLRLAKDRLSVGSDLPPVLVDKIETITWKPDDALLKRLGVGSKADDRVGLAHKFQGNVSVIAGKAGFDGGVCMAAGGRRSFDGDSWI
ncbi:predicted protein [Plenodomus lingam JN3]|uniref:Predicted protein n=1 Tax=Leptosphaeria maculans (strain JN3 / isolate v23.1.3 / race Av1-4-5-6-7-8) TaxID=985895 RepID=E5AD80_LEPMJ|nr:predicted protein [Plenodomus lingam JN3]CBY02432.1 predicted protein [Plenodomus lingam JN3]